MFKTQVLVVFEKIINKTFGCIVTNVVTLQHNKKPPPAKWGLFVWETGTMVASEAPGR